VHVCEREERSCAAVMFCRSMVTLRCVWESERECVRMCVNVCVSVRGAVVPGWS